MHNVYQTERLILKILSPDHCRAVLDFQLRNRDRFEPYEPSHVENFYTVEHQQQILRCECRLAAKLSTIRFYVYRKEDPRTIIGTVCLHDILRFPYSCCEIGYKFDYAFLHYGYAREAAKKALEIAFLDLELHRVFARVVPTNAPSINLLRSLSFVEEGLEHGCTKIQGKWTDHMRFAKLSPIPC